MREPITESSPAPRESAFGRIAGGVRRLAGTLRRAADDTDDSLGERYVHMGLAVAALGILAMAAGSMLAHGAFSWRATAGALGAVAVNFVIGAGVLSSSGWARFLMDLQAMGYGVGAIFVARQLWLRPAGWDTPGFVLLMLGMLAYAVGTVLATSTKPAQAWHAAGGERRRERRKAKSLADWRTAAEKADAAR